MTQEQRVKNRLKEVGYVDTFWAIENYMLRLAAIICELKKQGYTFEGKFGEGKDKKNYFYHLKAQPKEGIKYIISPTNILAGHAFINGKSFEIFPPLKVVEKQDRLL